MAPFWSLHPADVPPSSKVNLKRNLLWSVNHNKYCTFTVFFFLYFLRMFWPSGQIADASAPTDIQINLNLKYQLLSTLLSSRHCHSGPLETSVNVKGEHWQLLHSHNIPAVLLTGISGTLRTLFCERLNKNIRLIVVVCNRDWEVTPSFNPKVNQNSMWIFELSSRFTLMSMSEKPTPENVFPCLIVWIIKSPKHWPDWLVSGGSLKCGLDCCSGYA